MPVTLKCFTYFQLWSKIWENSWATNCLQSMMVSAKARWRWLKKNFSFIQISVPACSLLWWTWSSIARRVFSQWINKASRTWCWLWSSACSTRNQNWWIWASSRCTPWLSSSERCRWSPQISTRLPTHKSFARHLPSWLTIAMWVASRCMQWSYKSYLAPCLTIPT